jgi:aspartate racemase
MKTLGMIGGLGPESTIDYYRFLIAAYRTQVDDDSAPPIIINSIDMNKGLRMVGAERYGELVDYLIAELNVLANAGAAFAIISANTPHIVFDEVDARTPLPLISIVEATVAEARKQGLQKLTLFGTRFTMQGSFYPKVFARHGISLVIPTPEEIDYIHDKYMNELLFNDVRESTREGLFRIIDRMIEQEGIDGVILGGTELPLAIRNLGDRKISLLDTTRIHVNAAIEEMLRE